MRPHISKRGSRVQSGLCRVQGIDNDSLNVFKRLNEALV